MNFKKLLQAGLVATTILTLGACDSQDVSKAVDHIEKVTAKVEQAKNTPAVENHEVSELTEIPYDAGKYPENYVSLGKAELTPEHQALLQRKGTDKAWQEYTNLDSLGRSGKATALVTHDAVKKHSSAYLKQHGLQYGDKMIYGRPDFPSYVHVSGEYKDGRFDKYKQRWKGRQSNNYEVRKGYWLYNKSHTIGWSLGGNMETQNVTLGTRSQNVGTNKDQRNGGGMAHMETQVRNAVTSNPDTKVLVEVTPIYKGSELVPRGSHVTAYSVNDNGQSVNLNEWVFNAEQGVTIDYMTGSAH